ncbi:MAG: valine--tRNA ligase [Oscillospiraceae bacterium]|jgi:valyl-tRNA synthetase|nr:valine--tRNA ligase [Oscillospiraceae bacterium]
MADERDGGLAIDLEKTYQPASIETELYEKWENEGKFKPQANPERVSGAAPFNSGASGAEHPSKRKAFTIVMPPPNITGQLHLGHAMDVVFQDALTRFHRMLGDPTLWLPGTDHASIATEVKILDAMREEGQTKESLGRDGFLERAWIWKEQYGGRIVRQLRKLGASCDWSRERFTLDEGCSAAVTETFVRLYEKGLIYRANRIINWCPDCRTALSDAEVEYEEQASHLWHIRYSGADGKCVVVATTRPETMLGDTGVAVHPGDKRYVDLIGKTVTLPIVNRELPVIADEYVDPAFGTGAVKMTPAHDPNDFEIAQRHGLRILNVMNDDGTMNENAGEYAGLPALEARAKIVAELERLGLLVKVEPYTHNVGGCYRCGHTVEPLVSDQWFVSMKPLAEPALEAVRAGRTKFEPDRFARTYYHWMENIRDWCVSRQLWWGHRIPAYYCGACGDMTVARTRPDACPKCGSNALRQDEDVLDTWFSSALWPFSTLGWPNDTDDLRTFYPTSVLVTSYDIIFFWVARMIFSGIEHMGETPFHTVLIHGLVRDAQGRKMSKSAGNGIDPLELIDKYGADALRFSLVMGVAPGNDTRLSIEKVEAARNFANKLWNAARFVRMNLDGDAPNINPERLDLADKWILTRYQETVRSATRHLNEYDLGLASQELYDFIWNAYCDWTIELSKGALFGDDADAREKARAVLAHVLDGALKLLHPFMPFITEKLYGLLPLPAKRGMLIEARWPEVDPALDFPEEARQMEGVIEIVRAVRALRLERSVSPGKRARLYLLPQPGWSEPLRQAAGVFERLAYAQDVVMLDNLDDAPRQSAKAVCPAADAILPLGELLDLAKERARLAKARENAERELSRGESKLANEGFLKKAPPELIEEERRKLDTRRAMLESIKAQEAQLE